MIVEAWMALRQRSREPRVVLGVAEPDPMVQLLPAGWKQVVQLTVAVPALFPAVLDVVI